MFDNLDTLGDSIAEKADVSTLKDNKSQQNHNQTLSNILQSNQTRMSNLSKNKSPYKESLLEPVKLSSFTNEMRNQNKQNINLQELPSIDQKSDNQGIYE